MPTTVTVSTGPIVSHGTDSSHGYLAHAVVGMNRTRRRAVSRLHLWTADGWGIVAEGKVLLGRLGRAIPKVLEVAVAESPLPAGLQGVVGQTIDQLVIADDGRLIVQVGRRGLIVLADQRYEAWHITGPHGELLVCMPGGELAYFPPVRRGREAGTAEPSPGDDAPSGA